MDFQSALSETAKWSVDDQLKLIDHVWTRLVDSGWQPTLSEVQKSELDRRIAANDANPDKVYSREEVLDYIRRPR
jgi:putative addiction module component (TIGR02574 family)